VRGIYPAEAHQLAMSASLGLQLAAFAWFALPQRSVRVPAMARAANRSLSAAHAWPATVTTSYAMAALAWTQHVELASKQVAGWRSAAAASAVLCVGVAVILLMTLSRPAVAVHIFEVDRLVPASVGRSNVATLIDGPAALELARNAKVPPW
jgi:hypothetical protein